MVARLPDNAPSFQFRSSDAEEAAVRPVRREQITLNNVQPAETGDSL
jgi:hypothetical protein